MDQERPRNLAASVKQRLMNQAKAQEVEFQRILVLYGLERLLYRISASPFSEEFILKGAILLSLWFDAPYRRTRDIDLLGKDTPSPERFAAVFQDLCKLAVEEDGLRFDQETVTAKPIREGNEFGGVRVQLTAFLEGARIPLQVDIGFGDAAVPEPEQIEFPVLLSGFPAPVLRAYQKETTIAEKLHALVALERSNSRMKDFFDLYVLSQGFAFEGERLRAAVGDAFAKRSTPIPPRLPDGLSMDFARDPHKQSQWRAFVRQSVAAPLDTINLEQVIPAIAAFLWPVLEALVQGAEFPMSWPAGGLWVSDEGLGESRGRQA